jgi:hypothetical protein
MILKGKKEEEEGKCDKRKKGTGRMRRRWDMKKRSRTKKSRRKVEGGRGVKIGEIWKRKNVIGRGNEGEKRTIRRETSSWCHGYGRVKMSQSLPSR